MLKNRPVNTPGGSLMSLGDVFVNVIVSVLPENTKSADADRLPLDPVNIKAWLVAAHVKTKIIESINTILFTFLSSPWYGHIFRYVDRC